MALDSTFVFSNEITELIEFSISLIDIFSKDVELFSPRKIFTLFFKFTNKFFILSFATSIKLIIFSDTENILFRHLSSRDSAEWHIIVISFNPRKPELPFIECIFLKIMFIASDESGFSSRINNCSSVLITDSFASSKKSFIYSKFSAFKYVNFPSVSSKILLLEFVFFNELLFILNLKFKILDFEWSISIILLFIEKKISLFESIKSSELSINFNSSIKKLSPSKALILLNNIESQISSITKYACPIIS